MMPATRSGWRRPVWSAIAPPCEKPASTRRLTAVPRSFSRAIRASIRACEARTPLSSSRRIAPSVMSYQARMCMPPLIVTGCTGACGNTKRIAALGSFRAGTMAAKSFPSAPSPCNQIMLAEGFLAVSISMASRYSAICSGFLRADRGLGTEGLDHLFTRLDVRPADEIDAIGNGREDARDEGFAVLVLEAFERFADRLGLARQVDDQRALAHHRDLPREDRGGNELEADPAHLLAESRHGLVCDRQRRLGRNVAGRGPRAAGGQHQVAAGAVDELGERGLDHGSLVRDEALVRAPGTDHDAGEPLLERRDPLVLVYAARSPVADRHEPDEQLVACCRHGSKYIRAVSLRRPRARIRPRSRAAP